MKKDSSRPIHWPGLPLVATVIRLLRRDLTLHLALCVAVLSTTEAPAGVLFLAHYNKTLDADVPAGTPGRATVRRASVTSGAKGVAFADALPGPEAADLAYSEPSRRDAAILYDASNIDTRQGTIQMWVKSRWAWDLEAKPGKPVQHMFLSVPMTGPKKPGLYLYFAADPGHHFIPHLVFNIYDGRRDHVTNVRLDRRRRIAFDPKPNEWHYIVVTWTPRRTRLFLDGKLVSERDWDRPIDLTPPAGPIVVGNSWRRADRPAEALIDEVRIVDHALFADAKVLTVPTRQLPAHILGASYAAGGPTTARRPERRRMYCYRVDTPPVIDGKLDDPAWQRLPAASGFTTNDSRHAIVPEQTDVQVCHDGTNLYLAVTCHEDRLDGLRTRAKGPKRTLRVFDDDAIEVFLSSNAKAALPYIQMGINAINTTGDQLCEKPARGKATRIPWRSAVGKRPGAWCVEVAFPLAALAGANAKAKVGDVWRWNVCRDRRVAGLQYSSMNFVVGGFHSPSEFGDLIFAAKPAAPRLREEARMNTAYLAHVRAEVSRLADQVKRELGLAKTVSPEVIAQAKLGSLLADIRRASGRLSAFAQKDGEHTIGEWSGVLLNCKGVRKSLERFAFRISGLGPTGPIRPPADLKPGLLREGDYWFLASDLLTVAIDARTGAVAGLWERAAGKRLLTASYDQYLAETRAGAMRSDERMDRVAGASAQGNRLALTCTNPDLPGVRFVKTYRLESVAGERRMLARQLRITGTPTERTLLSVASTSLFDTAFRKDAWYDRVMVIGTAGDPRSTIPAAEITAPLIQRAWFNSSEGRAQFAMVHPKLGIGLGQYLYTENGQWTFPQALAQSYWTPFGWQMGSAATFLSKKPYTAETRYHLFRGDRLSFHHEYWSLPEYAALRRQWTPHPAMRHIRNAGAGFQMMNLNRYKKGSRARAYVDAIAGTWGALCRPNEVAISLTGPQDNRWSHYPAGDGEEFVQYDSANATVLKNGRHKARDVRTAFKKLHTLFPHHRMGLYKFIVDISVHSPVFKEHPQWLLRDRRGNAVSGYYGPGYWLANWSPAFVDYLADALLKQVDYLDEDFLYLDFGPGIRLADWGRGQVVGFDTYFGFLKRLQSALAGRGKFLWLNASTGQPFYDVGYWEGSCSARKPWRARAGELLMRKIYTRPGAVTVPIYWLGGDMFRRQGRYNEQVYINMVLGLGFPATGCWLDPYAEHFPAGKEGCDWASVVKYQAALGAATLEYYNAQWCDIGLEPAWWRDLTTPYEAYTLKQGSAWLLNVTSHAKDTRNVTFAIAPKRMGLDPSRRTFLWQHSVRDPAKFPKKVPLAPNWDKMFERITCRTVEPGKALDEVTLVSARPELVEVTVLTQVPAVLLSVAGKPTQTRQPSTLDCSVDRRLDEKARRCRLQVKAKFPVEIAVWWPKDWGQAIGRAIGADGKALPVQAKRFADWGQSFVRVPLPQGTWQVELHARDASPPPRRPSNPENEPHERQ